MKLNPEQRARSIQRLSTNYRRHGVAVELETKSDERRASDQIGKWKLNEVAYQLGAGS